MTAHLRTSVSRLVVSGVSLLVVLLLAFGIVGGVLPAASASNDATYGSECSVDDHAHRTMNGQVLHKFVREHDEVVYGDSGGTSYYHWHIWEETSGPDYGWWSRGEEVWFLCSYKGPTE